MNDGLIRASPNEDSPGALRASSGYSLRSFASLFHARNRGSNFAQSG